MSGYVACSCRDCFEIAIGTDGAALCCGCEEAGCGADLSTGERLECRAERDPTPYCSVCRTDIPSRCICMSAFDIND